MAQTTTPTKKSVLKSWFFNAPAKFALLSMGVMMGTAIIYSLFKAIMSGGNVMMSPTPLVILMLAGLVFSICMLVKWLPNDNLDRRSFVAIDNGLTFLYFAFIIVSSVFIVASVQHIMFYIMWLQSISIILFIFTALIACLVYLYVLGLLISNIYATYRRALGMGVPKWKALLSFPFSFALLWMPGYFLNDDTKTKPVVTIKSKWYSSFTDWVVAKPINAVLVLLVTLGLSALFMDIYSACLTSTFAIIFGIWVLILGTKLLRKNIGGAFATFAAALNIAAIITFVGYLAFYPKPQVTVQYDNVEVVETVVTE